MTSRKPWSGEAILDVMHGYQQACVLGAAAELDLFDAVGPGPFTAEDATRATGADPRAMTVLLDALTAIRLLDKDGPSYRAADGVHDALTARGPGSVLAMVQHQMNCLRRWARLADVVKTGKPQPRDGSIRGEAKDYASFVEAMDNIGRATAGPIVTDLPKGGFSHLLDVGGASGTYAIAFLKANPQAVATIVDLPKVIPQARERIAAAGMPDRVTLVGADFMTDDLPAGADLAWVSAIIHSLSRKETRNLLRKVYNALVPGGRIWIREVYMDESRTRPAFGALFAVNMLTGTEGGRTFTIREVTEDLESAGFTGVELLRADEAMSAVVGAVKPA